MDLCYNIRDIFLQYFYTQINNNKMQRELFNNMLGSSFYVYMFQLQPFEGGRDADVAHGENESDTPGLDHIFSQILLVKVFRDYLSLDLTTIHF